jgi:hypothetical protein
MEPLQAQVSDNETHHAVTYNCPACGVVLGCQVDPIAIRNDIINTVVQRSLARAESSP